MKGKEKIGRDLLASRVGSSKICRKQEVHQLCFGPVL